MRQRLLYSSLPATQLCTLLISLLCALFTVSAQGAQPIDLAASLDGPLGQHIDYFFEQQQELSLVQAAARFDNQASQKSLHPVLSFGFGSKPIWLRFEVDNRDVQTQHRQLSIENSWLDHINVFVRHQRRTHQQFYAGDAQPFSDRLIDNLFFNFPLDFANGKSIVYIRVQTPDTLLLPLFLLSDEQVQDRQLLSRSLYGFIYGFLIALIAYNSILFFSLKSSRYLYYIIYLGGFLFTNLSYTGHAYRWFWPESPLLQQWGIPTFMILYSCSGLLFASKFLQTKQQLPGIHSILRNTNIAVLLVLVLAMLLNQILVVLALAFILMLAVFPILMLLAGAVSLRSGNQSAKYFLLAAVASLFGATITALSVLVNMPYSLWAFHAVELGMLIDAILLALALSHHFRLTLEDKAQAEKLAAIDQLTGINNRRGFYHLANPILSTADRNQRNIALVMFDIDRFKLINDQHGHLAGDKVIQSVAQVLKLSARAGDIIARWGGEEFILLLPETNLEDAVSLAERLRQSMATTLVPIDNGELNFTASFGVALMHPSLTSFDDLVALTDKHLYQAKKLGRNQTCHELQPLTSQPEQCN